MRDELSIKFNGDIVREYLKRVDMNTVTMISMEECGELIQAISKTKRKLSHETMDHLIEEMGDVLICINNLMIKYGISPEDVQEWIDYKEKRTLQRIEDGII